MTLEEATIKALESKLLREDKEDNTDINKQFEALINKYRGENLNIGKEDNYKYENGKLYYKSANGWHLDNIKITRNIGPFKVGAVHFNCALPYSNYYIINTITGDVYVMRDVIFYRRL